MGIASPIEVLRSWSCDRGGLRLQPGAISGKGKEAMCAAWHAAPVPCNRA